MKRLQAFKYELMPNGEQRRAMRRFAGSCRFVFNKALAWQKERYAADKTTTFSYTVLANFLPIWKAEKETEWLKNSPSQSLQQVLKDLERAYQNFFAKRAAFPRFKRKGQSDSFRYPQGVKLDQGNSRLFLPKLGWVRYRNSRDVLGTVKNVTVSHKAGRWFASIQTEREVAPPVPQATAAVGIDLGIARRDYLHKISTTISQNHAMVCIEDLKVSNMSKSAAGTIDVPGKNVNAKRGLNKAILDQGWFAFRRHLDYKLAWRGGWLVAVPPHYTSQTCPECGHCSKANRPTQADFACVQCGFEENADVVGAINILRAGHAQFACEVSGAVRPPAAGTHRSDLEAAPCRA